MKNKKVILAGALICAAGLCITGTAGYFPANFQASEIFAVEASSSDVFVASATDVVRSKIYSNGVSSFKMKGRTYYQGIVFGNATYEDNAEVSFNVEDIKSLSFDLGHVDGSSSSSTEFSVYLDGTLEDKFTLTQNEPIKEYTLDVSEASVVRIFRNGDYSQYAIGDVCVDGVQTAYTHTVPEYSTVATFLSDSMDRLRATVYDGTSSEKYFNMKGRSYYQGIVLGDGSYEDDASVTFNVENAESLSFSLGHVDNSNSSSTEFSIFVDDVLEDKFTVTQNEPIYEYTVNVSQASTVRIFRNGDYSRYAIADISIDEKAPEKTYASPVYKTSSAMLSSVFDNFRTSCYDGSSQAISFNMNGRTYYQGIVLGDGSYEDNAAFSLNVENLSSITFDMGHVDGTSSNETEFTIYLDNEIVDKFKLGMNLPLQSYTIDVSNAKTLRIYRTGDYSKYGLGNIKADELVPKNTYSVPEYKNSAGFITSLFDTYRTKTYDGVSSAISFNMNGRIYSQGVVFGDGSYEDNAAGSFNVENYSRIHFTAGHVDDTNTGSADFTIYLDNEPVETFTLSAGKPVQEFDIDVSNASVMRIFRNGDYSKYALADIIVDEIVPKNTVKIPVYNSAAKMLDASFDNLRSSVYTDADKFSTFSMNGKDYSQGIIIGNGSYEKGAGISLNVECANTLSFVLGCIDLRYSDSAELIVYGDGTEIASLTVTKDMVEKPVTLNVLNYKNVRFYLDQNYISAGLGDFTFSSETPSAVPSEEPSAAPSETPTAIPSEEPSAVPSETPTAVPTEEPSAVPSETPTAVPTEEPSVVPSETPSAVPTEEPSAAPTTVPTAEATPSAAPTSAPSVQKGDIDGDGAVTTTDVKNILKYIVGKIKFTEAQTADADINGDGTVNSADALLLLRTVVGQTETK